MNLTDGTVDRLTLAPVTRWGSPRRFWLALELLVAILLLGALLWQVWNLPRLLGNGRCPILCALARYDADLLLWPERHYKILRTIMVGLLGLVVVGSFVRLRDSAWALGLRSACLRRGWWPAVLGTGFGLALVLLFGWWAGSLGWRTLFSRWLLDYLPGLVFQQLMLQWFVGNRLSYLGPHGSTVVNRWFVVLVGGVVFSLMHAPNLPLMALTLVGGMFWLWHFQSYRNLPAVMAGHLICGVGAMIGLGDGLLSRLAVGWPMYERLSGL